MGTEENGESGTPTDLSFRRLIEEKSWTPTNLSFRRLIEISTNPTVSSPTGLRQNGESGTPTDLSFRRLIEIATNPTVSSPTGLRQRQDCHANSAEAHRR
jgi:hypothetical protein